MLFTRQISFFARSTGHRFPHDLRGAADVIERLMLDFKDAPADAEWSHAMLAETPENRDQAEAFFFAGVGGWAVALRKRLDHGNLNAAQPQLP